MLLKYFYDNGLAQASYMVGCAETGEAIVVDPSRDVTPYLETARQEGLRITHVTETHIHADFVSGSRELASVTGARLYLSDMGGRDWKYGFEGTPIRDGDSWNVGNIRIKAIHTPGHTPEHLVFQVTDTARANAPIGVFTGDFLFVGDVGRPDLLEEAAGIADTSEYGARQQFANVQRFKAMADYLQVWPGHGAGSACGKALGAIPSTTLGYEKRFNPAFQFDNEEVFVRWLLTDQPETPRYFAQMKRVNRAGPTLLRDLPDITQLDGGKLDEVLEADHLVMDTRSPNEFARGHTAGTLSIPGSSDKFSTYAGWFVDFEKPTYLVAEETEVECLVQKLRAIGIDNIPGYFSVDALNGSTQSLARVTAQELADQLSKGDVTLIDVRAATEHHSQRIPGARHIHFGKLPHHLDELMVNSPIVLQCASGIRSHIAASYLQRHGFQNVANLKGGIEAWTRADLPVEEGS
jgi:hydroxyacylglutathione hydrolase